MDMVILLVIHKVAVLQHIENTMVKDLVVQVVEVVQLTHIIIYIQIMMEVIAEQILRIHLAMKLMVVHQAVALPVVGDHMVEEAVVTVIV